MTLDTFTFYISMLMAVIVLVYAVFVIDDEY